MKLPFVFAHRPSRAMVVASTALFVSLGGVGYAATQIPANSVGARQLRSHAVTAAKIDFLAVGSRKIQLGAVGSRRINPNQVQVRVTGTCAAGAAVGSIGTSGKTTCNPTLPQRFGITGTAAVSAARIGVASVVLPPGATYLAFANPTATISVVGPGEHVSVNCTLTVGANSQTRSATVDTGVSRSKSAVSIPLMVAGPSGTATVACLSSTSTVKKPSVSVTTAIEAIQTSRNS